MFDRGLSMYVIEEFYSFERDDFNRPSVGCMGIGTFLIIV